MAESRKSSQISTLTQDQGDIGKKPTGGIRKNLNPNRERNNEQKKLKKVIVKSRNGEEVVIIEKRLDDQENLRIAKGLRKPTNCNLALVPPRSTAFKAPCVKLPVAQYDQDGEPLPVKPDGLSFCFFPRGDHCTQVSFTVEPRRVPLWQQMMRCGFVPIINCAVPPCCLPEPIQNRGVYFEPPDYSTSSSSSSSSSSSESEPEPEPAPVRKRTIVKSEEHEYRSTNGSTDVDDSGESATTEQLKYFKAQSASSKPVSAPGSIGYRKWKQPLAPGGTGDGTILNTLTKY